MWLDAATTEAEWAVNATGLAPGADVTLAIVDGNPGGKLSTGECCGGRGREGGHGGQRRQGASMERVTWQATRHALFQP